MTEQPPQEPTKKFKGLPTWLWFVGTFGIVSLLGNIVFGGNTWITSSANFIENTIYELQLEEDHSQDAFCLSGTVSEIDKDNTLTVVTEAESLVGTTSSAIGYASTTDVTEELANAINIVRESGAQYLTLGERILTAKECQDATYEYLMEDFGNSLVDMGNNFGQWDPETLANDPVLLITVMPLIETAATKARAILTYVETLK
ncbi:unannotated protein [freshwater metagenome]|uniref:Unannotated protein n=1 Tax=freshwater metagenome TaxID=449393 RepID=A0A6J6J4I2_9ZZZZ|nr:hypothetical protein [Actinomycetota bacterium]